VEHAFTDFGPNENVAGIVTLHLYIDGENAVAEIRDNGRGLGVDFTLDVPTSLGLSIVRDLVRAQLHGSIEMTTVPQEQGGGTFVRVTVPTTERD
jgi:two-component sensor histidine kinase